MSSNFPGFPPDPRYGVNAVLGTSGKPAQSVGDEGDLATDPDDPQGSALYIKSTSGWKFIATGVEV